MWIYPARLLESNLHLWMWERVLGQEHQERLGPRQNSHLLEPDRQLRTQWGSVLCAAAAAAKSLQSCPTLCDPMDGSWPGSPVPGILQARTLEWVAISFSNAWKWKVKVKSLSRVLATPWTTAHQAPPSMGFSRQEYWSGVPLPFLPADVTPEQNS